MRSLTHSAVLAETVASLRSGRLDLTAYVDGMCDRIDSQDPHIEALLPEPGRRARLKRDAETLRARFPQNRPALYGALVGVKDIFRTDGFPTRCGSSLPPELFAGTEAASVSRLRGAGALILGKTVTTEFAHREPGPTRNPHNLAHTPGGSSSGSAAAVAAGFCTLALGTQTIGSVIRPAAYCGILGFKPSYGRISTVGVIPYSESCDHVGIFTQDLAGMVLAASILCDPWQSTHNSARPVLGVPEGPYLDQVTPEARAAFEKQISILEKAGYRILRLPAFEDIGAINRRHWKMTAAELAQVHARWFTRHEALYRPQTAATIREGQKVQAEELTRGRNSQSELRAELQSLMDRGGIDLWISPPAMGPAPEGISSTGNPSMNLPWTHVGLPTLTLPAGKAPNDLPLGIQLTARLMKDESLLAWAEGLAQFFP